MIDTQAIRRAAELLRAGGLVAFPTETVYGLGADAENREAVARLYAVKRRAATHPVIVHVARAAQAFDWALDVPDAARVLAERFWPGPLTLILRRATHVGDFITGGQDCVGLRVPAHPVAQALLQAFGALKDARAGIAAPSANRSGFVSPTSAAHVRGDLGGDVDCVLEGGSSEIGIESTIIDLSGALPMLLRPGHITREELERVLRRPLAEPNRAAPRVPGSLERHYAPRTPTRLVASHELDRALADLGARAGVLAFSRPDERVACWLRMPRAAGAYAAKLYSALRELDERGCGAILIEAPPDTPEWAAVRDRLRRAAAAP